MFSVTTQLSVVQRVLSQFLQEISYFELAIIKIGVIDGFPNTEKLHSISIS